MSEITVYHNPRCSKSRAALELLNAHKIEPIIRLYLLDNPSQKELKTVLKALGIKASQLVRKTEAIYKEQFKGQELTESQWIKALVENPKLIERPIIIKGEKAVIGRPTELILDLIGK